MFDFSFQAVQTLCQVLYLFVNYSGTATYFWMLSEGLYLLVILIFTFNKSQLIVRFCIVLGWGKSMRSSLFVGSQPVYGRIALLSLLAFVNRVSKIRYRIG